MFACAGAVWRFDPCKRCDEKEAVDPGYWVQMQFQMHAAGAPTSFLGQWTMRSRTALYQMDYSRVFMEKASLVLMHVISQYLQSDGRYPPSNMDHEPNAALKEAWYSMMHALADVIAGVRCLCHPGGNPSSSVGKHLVRASASCVTSDPLHASHVCREHHRSCQRACIRDRRDRSQPIVATSG